MGAYVPISSNALCRWLVSNGWMRIGGKGDHGIYKDAAGRHLEVPIGGRWSKSVPQQVIKRLCTYSGKSRYELLREI